VRLEHGRPRRPPVAIAEGTFDPEAVYGRFPPSVPARPESSLARAERKRGSSVPSLPCASLVVYGDDFRAERGTSIARLYGSEERDFPGLDHWELVRDRRVREAIAGFLGVSSDQRSWRGPGSGGTSFALPSPP
jgi:hypothetical protein